MNRERVAAVALLALGALLYLERGRVASWFTSGGTNGTNGAAAAQAGNPDGMYVSLPGGQGGTVPPSAVLGSDYYFDEQGNLVINIGGNSQ